MKKNELLVLALVFLLLSAMPLEAAAALRLEAPASAGKGSAFVARAFSDQPVGEIVFIWNGKRHAARTEAFQGGSAASILLPVALEEKASHIELAANAAGSAPARASVDIVEVERPVQKLQVDKKFVTPPPEAAARIKADREKVRQALRTTVPGRHWDIPFLRPVTGGVSSQFGLKRVFNGETRGQHKGLDLRGAEGTPIKACADGVVALVDNLYYSGNTVYVNHGEGVFSAYLHMSGTDVQPGQEVRRGQVIGRVGATGRVTGPHLHLTVFAQGVPVDPLPLLEKQPEAPAAVRPAKAGARAR